MQRLICSALAITLLLVSGLVHGYWTDRWKPATDLTRAADRLDGIPLTLGDWDGHPLEVKASAVDPRVTRCLERRYVNRVSGEAVAIALVVGRAGPISIHTPEVCYSASGYVISSRGAAVIPGRSEEFFTMDAVRTRGSDESRIRLYWAWNAGSGWETAVHPRLKFAARRVLYKLYVTRDLTNLGEPSREDPCVTFLQVLLPELQEALFSEES